VREYDKMTLLLSRYLALILAYSRIRRDNENTRGHKQDTMIYRCKCERGKRKFNILGFVKGKRNVIKIEFVKQMLVILHKRR